MPILRYWLIAIIVLGALLGMLAAWLWNRPLTGEPSPRRAPEFRLKDYQGREVSLSDFRGRPVVVNSWAAWCPFCVAEMPDFAALQEEFEDKIAVILVNRAEPLETAKKFSDEVGVTGRIVLLLDPGDSFYRAIGGFSMPETIFVDENGMIKDHKRGPMSLEEMRRRTEQAFGL